MTKSDDSNTSSNHDFYQNIPSFCEFSELTNLAHYKHLPDNWIIGVSDIVNSTTAIQDGAYRKVNMVGVAPIVGVLNHLDHDKIPFVFGGDGCFIAVPKGHRTLLENVFSTAASIAKSAFGLELRAAVAPVGKISDKAEFLVARYEVSSIYKQSVFLGGGIERAEDMIKSGELDLLEPTVSAEIGFDGLECRWKPVKSPTGLTVTLIIKALGDKENAIEQYQRFFRFLDQLSDKSDSLHPVREDMLENQYSLMNFMAEQKFSNRAASALKQFVNGNLNRIKTAVGNVMMNNEIETSETNWALYKQDMVKNADIRKFDDMIRMVISCTEKQFKQIDEYLSGQYQKGAVVYGTHRSDSAMVTCMVFKYQKEHIHFIDGNDGGYAMAAVQMKKQLKEISEQ